jgi:Zn-dependent protease
VDRPLEFAFKRKCALIGEPSPTQADLHFPLFGIPVRVHPFFWLMAAFLGANITGGQPELMFFWVLTVFVSILVHELGHALLIRQFGGRPWITLYAMGGLASSSASRIDPRAHIKILLAGPGAGFLLAAVIVALLRLSGHSVQFVFGWPFIIAWHFSPLGSTRLNEFVDYLLLVNIWWGLFNLLPIWPLDGGQLTRDAMELVEPRQAVRTSLWLSVFTAGGLAVYFISRQMMFNGFFMGYLAYQSYMMLEGLFGRGGGFGGRR